MVLSPGNLPHYIAVSKGKLFQITSYKLKLAVSQVVYAKNAVLWMDTMILMLSDGTYQIPALVDTDAVRKALGKDDLENEGDTLGRKSIMIKRSCLNICRKNGSVAPYLFILDFNIVGEEKNRLGDADITFQLEVRRWIATLPIGIHDTCSKSYNTHELQSAVRHLENQEEVLEYTISVPYDQLEEDEEEVVEEPPVQKESAKHRFYFETWEEYQKNVRKIFAEMTEIDDLDLWEQPKHVPPQPSKEDDDMEESFEREVSGSAIVDEGQYILEQLKITTVPFERNRLLHKLRKFYFNDKIYCSLIGPK